MSILFKLILMVRTINYTIIAMINFNSFTLDLIMLSVSNLDMNKLLKFNKKLDC